MSIGCEFVVLWVLNGHGLFFFCKDTTAGIACCGLCKQKVMEIDERNGARGKGRKTEPNARGDTFSRQAPRSYYSTTDCVSLVLIFSSQV